MNPDPKPKPSRPDGEGISVIIPALNEEGCVAAAVASARRAPGAEVIVADGNSRDATVARAAAAGARVIAAPPGRSRQMNAGALAARGQILLFLHADTLLPWGWQYEVRRVLALPGVAAGAFAFRLDVRSAGLRLIELGVAARCLLAQMPYGDQGLFLRREVFARLGGFPELPLMEDVALVRNLRRLGRVATSPAPAVTSARRWQGRGALRTTLLNSILLAGFYAGLPATTLHRLRQRH
ncbi:MAG: glycosyltransferase [Desulfarculus sp.]|nr:MAG: glycosyltransferase [Desulfarculus sp.]